MSDIIKRLSTGFDEGECMTNIWSMLDQAQAELDRLHERIKELESISIIDPYPVDLCHVDDEMYVGLVPDPVERTGISWYLMGRGWRGAMAEYQRMINEGK